MQFLFFYISWLHEQVKEKPKHIDETATCLAWREPAISDKATMKTGHAHKTNRSRKNLSLAIIPQVGFSTEHYVVYTIPF